MREIDSELTSANRNVGTTTTWNWHDLNGNRAYDSGEVNLDPNGLDFQSISGQAIRSIVLNVEPIGSLRLPSTNLLDLRVGKRFALGGARSFEIRADIYNALNVNTTLERVVRSGPDYLRTGFPAGATIAVQSTVLPRIVQLGASYFF